MQDLKLTNRRANRVDLCLRISSVDDSKSFVMLDKGQMRVWLEMIAGKLGLTRRSNVFFVKYSHSSFVHYKSIDSHTHKTTVVCSYINDRK
jgi:hypothetical protein